ncbi:MAG: SGNH/GDSL hydrolase family protein [Planctomycetota bacterium]
MSLGFARAALVVATVLISVELLLQLGALVVSLIVAPDEFVLDQDRHRVLCLGDSFTYGIGAEDEKTGSYPAHLQQILEERAPGRYQVVNRGWPGLNSRKILRYLASDLDEVKPDTVVLLCGVNDRWSRPERLDLAEVSSEAAPSGRGRGFEWKLRTPRLVQMIFDWASPEPKVGAAEKDQAIVELSKAIEVFEQDGDEPQLLEEIRRLADRIAVERLHEVFGQDRQASGDRRERAADLVAAELGYERRGFHWRSLDGSSWVAVVTPELDESYDALLSVLQVWRDHLEQLVTLCREREIEVVFLTYPHQFELLDPETLEPVQEAFPRWAKTLTFPTRAIQRRGTELNVPVVETLGPMQLAAEGRDHRDFFVADAHCTSAGYRVMAGLVADLLLR